MGEQLMAEPQIIEKLERNLEEALNSIASMRNNPDKAQKKAILKDMKEAQKEYEETLKCHILPNRKAVAGKNDKEIEVWAGEVKLLLDVIKEPVRIENETDKEFKELMDFVQRSDYSRLMTFNVNNLATLKQQKEEMYQKIREYLAENPEHGTLAPENNDFSYILNHVVAVADNHLDIRHMYNKLADDKSRKTLYAILRNWIAWDGTEIQKVKEEAPAYFGGNILETGEDEVYADIGAGKGESVLEFVNLTDDKYKKIYIYEEKEENLDELTYNTEEMENVVFVKELKNIEPCTLIKISTHGMEKNVIMDLSEQIKLHKPKLIIELGGRTENLWEIGRTLENMDTDYDMYLRIWGGNVIAGGYGLLCIPKKN